MHLMLLLLLMMHLVVGEFLCPLLGVLLLLETFCPGIASFGMTVSMIWVQSSRRHRLLQVCRWSVTWYGLMLLLELVCPVRA